MLMVRITKRQTTYWDLDTEHGPIRVHFHNKKEHRFVSPAADAFEVTASHPVLLNYSEPWSQLSIVGSSADAAEVIGALASVGSTILKPWRNLAEYLNPSVTPTELIQAGGVLLDAPDSLVSPISLALTGVGVCHTLIRSRPAAQAPKALIVGRNFVVAEDFQVEDRK
jgi:hypothetical protein